MRIMAKGCCGYQELGIDMKKSLLFISLMALNMEVFAELKPLDEQALDEVVVSTGPSRPTHTAKLPNPVYLAGHEEFGLDQNIKNAVRTAPYNGYVLPVIAPSDIITGLPPGGFNPNETTEVVYTTTTTIWSP